MNNTIENIPNMVSIRQAAEATGLSYYCISGLCKANRINYIKSGTKIFVNLNSFIKFLNNNELV